ncbi:MAG: hypothetical protein LWX02_12430, partial [Deltaproteobacteria bacterium]|nr:hypothetical protein [Deltaproteobacteria bacterium]
RLCVPEFLWSPTASQFSEFSYLETGIKESGFEAKVALPDQAYLRYIDAGWWGTARMGSEDDGTRKPKNDTGTLLFLYQELSAR